MDHAVTKKQKIILSSFGLSEVDVVNSATEISSLLAKHQSLLTANEDEDDEGEEEDFYGEDEDDFIY